MSSPYVKLGLCKSLITPFSPCTEEPLFDEAILSCSLVNLDENPVLTDGYELKDPSGVPNKNCVEIDIPGEVDYIELVATTCSLFDPRLDAAFGYSEIIEKDDGSCIVLANTKAGADCLCECGDSSCQVRFSVVTWSLALCPDGTRHPGGQYAITIYPCVEPRPNTNTVTTSAEASGREYLFRLCELPDGTFATDVIDPVLAADISDGFDLEILANYTKSGQRCKYEYLSDVCPPGGCDCGTCGGDPLDPTITPAGEEPVKGEARATFASRIASYSEKPKAAAKPASTSGKSSKVEAADKAPVDTAAGV